MNPILLLHGALGSGAQLEPLKQLLEQTGKQVFSLNFSGHSGEPYAADGFGIEVFAHDVITFLQKNQIPQIDIFGYSMGGYVALWLAYQHPTRIGKIITLGTKFDWSIASATQEVKKLNAEKIEEKIPAFARLLERRHAPQDWKVLIGKTNAMMTALGEKPLLTETTLSQIKCPVCVLLGDQDDMADRKFSETVAQLLPYATFHLLADTPHPIEKAPLPLLHKHIVDFLQ